MRDRAALVDAHVGLVERAVRSAAKRVPRHVHRDDLLSAGFLGLAEAAAAYDATRGVPFERFADRRIRGAILDELRAHDWASRLVRARAREAERWRELLTQELARPATSADVSARSGVPQAVLDRTAAEVGRAALGRLQAPDGDPLELAHLGDSSEDLVEASERRRFLGQAIEALPDRLRYVLVGSFLQGRRMPELAAELGVTESRVSQLRTEAVELLRAAFATHFEEAPAEPVPDPRTRRARAYLASVGARRSVAPALALAC